MLTTVAAVLWTAGSETCCARTPGTTREAARSGARSRRHDLDLCYFRSRTACLDRNLPGRPSSAVDIQPGSIAKTATPYRSVSVASSSERRIIAALLATYIPVSHQVGRGRVRADVSRHLPRYRPLLSASIHRNPAKRPPHFISLGVCDISNYLVAPAARMSANESRLNSGRSGGRDLDVMPCLHSARRQDDRGISRTSPAISRTVDRRGEHEPGDDSQRHLVVTTPPVKAASAELIPVGCTDATEGPRAIVDYALPS